MTTTEDRVQAATADERYTETLKAIQALGTKGSGLAMELDEIVGERLGECRTDGVAEGMGGVVIDGNILLPDSSLRGFPVTVSIPAATSKLNPGFDDCRCSWGRAAWEQELESEARLNESRPKGEWSVRGYSDMQNGEILHSYLLDLDGPQPLEAIENLLTHFHDSCTPHDHGLETLVAQHNWRDPVGMRDLANAVDVIWDDLLKLEYLDEVVLGIRKPAFSGGPGPTFLGELRPIILRAS
jgi:hypothetical protein